MSSGIEILLLAPFLFPALAGSGTAVAGGAAASVVTVSGGSVVTTSAFAAGTTAATPLAAAGGAAVAGSAVLVAGAAGAALLAAQNLQCSYDAALCEYQKRLDAEQAENAAAKLAGDASQARAQKTRVRAAESAELAFLRAGAQRLQKRLDGWPDVDPRLPDGCARLLEEAAQPAPVLRYFRLMEN